MTTPPSTEKAETPLMRDLNHAVRYYLGNRRGLTILAGLGIVAGLALNWSWLAAAGIAPILISVLPCLAMCALGLCMNWGSGRSCSAAAEAPDTTAVDGAVPATQSIALDAPPELSAPELRYDGPDERADGGVQQDDAVHEPQRRAQRAVAEQSSSAPERQDRWTNLG